MRFGVGPVCLELPELPEALEAPLRPFEVQRPLTHALVLEEPARDRTPGDPTVPLPQVLATAEGLLLVSGGLRARFSENRLVVSEAATTGELASAIRWLLAFALLEQNAVLLHGVGLATEQHGGAFTGPSGAGKSTLGRYASSGGLRCIGDELVGISAAGELFGTPWNVGAPATVKLRQVGLIGWSNEPKLTTIAPARWLQVAASNVLLPLPGGEGRARVFAVLSSVLQSVRAVRIDFAQDARVSDVLKRALQ